MRLLSIVVYRVFNVIVSTVLILSCVFGQSLLEVELGLRSVPHLIDFSTCVSLIFASKDVFQNEFVGAFQMSVVGP